MAIREIVKSGDDVLKKKCRPVESFDDKLALLLDDMFETMYAADGVGLAAPQVGLLRRVVVVDVGDDAPVELINPVIIEKSGNQRGVEGCLSCPNQVGITDRPEKVKVQAQDRHGNTFITEGEGLRARAFCHELDHLDGVLFTDVALEVLTPEEFAEKYGND